MSAADHAAAPRCVVWTPLDAAHAAARVSVAGERGHGRPASPLPLRRSARGRAASVAGRAARRGVATAMKRRWDAQIWRTVSIRAPHRWHTCHISGWYGISIGPRQSLARCVVCFDWRHTAGIHDMLHMDVTTRRDTLDTQLIRPRYPAENGRAQHLPPHQRRIVTRTYSDGHVGGVCGEKEKIGPHPTSGQREETEGRARGGPGGGSDRSPPGRAIVFLHAPPPLPSIWHPRHDPPNAKATVVGCPCHPPPQKAVVLDPTSDRVLITTLEGLEGGGARTRRLTAAGSGQRRSGRPPARQSWPARVAPPAVCARLSSARPALFPSQAVEWPPASPRPETVGPRSVGQGGDGVA